MKCRKARKYIQRFIGGEADDRVFDSVVKKHLTHCEDCKRFYNEMKSIKLKMSETERVKTTEQMMRSALNTIRETAKPIMIPVTGWMAMVKNRLAPALALMIIIVSVLGTFFSFYDINQTLRTEVEIVDLIYL